MKQFTIYDPSTGQILRTGLTSEEDFNLQAQPNEMIIEGFYSDDKYYWSGTEFVEISEKPSPLHYFDYTTKQWVFNEQLAIYLNRNKRNQLLASSDWTQMPDVTIANKSEWAVYRQQLRDMTDADFISGEFPTSPQS